MELVGKELIHLVCLLPASCSLDQRLTEKWRDNKHAEEEIKRALQIGKCGLCLTHQLDRNENSIKRFLHLTRQEALPLSCRESGELSLLEGLLGMEEGVTELDWNFIYLSRSEEVFYPPD